MTKKSKGPQLIASDWVMPTGIDLSKLLKTVNLLVGTGTPQEPHAVAFRATRDEANRNIMHLGTQTHPNLPVMWKTYKIQASFKLEVVNGEVQ